VRTLSKPKTSDKPVYKSITKNHRLSLSTGDKEGIARELLDVVPISLHSDCLQSVFFSFLNSYLFLLQVYAYHGQSNKQGFPLQPTSKETGIAIPFQLQIPHH
jgi:hypothetical protein